MKLVVVGLVAVSALVTYHKGSQSHVEKILSQSSSSLGLQPQPASCTSALPPHGVATMQDYKKNVQTCLYHVLEKYSNDWMDLHRGTMGKYAEKWVKDPFHWWSRTYEYVFHVKYVTEELDRLQQGRGGGGDAAIQVLDAGAGTDFISWYLLEEWPSSRPSDGTASIYLTAADYDEKNGNHHAEINERYTTAGKPWVNTHFVQTALQKMPFQDAQFDVLFCVSVLEHTDDYKSIVEEFHRVVKPGGLVVLTFDINLEDTGKVSPARAQNLLDLLQSRFDVVGGPLTTKTAKDLGAAVNTDGVATSGRIYELMSAVQWKEIHGRWKNLGLAFHCSTWRKRK